MRIYMVMLDWMYEDGTTNTFVVGVYSSAELAIEAAKKVSKQDAFGHATSINVIGRRLDTEFVGRHIWNWSKKGEES